MKENCNNTNGQCVNIMWVRPPFRFFLYDDPQPNWKYYIVDSKAFSFQLSTIFNQMVTHLLLDFHDSFSKQVKRQKDDKNFHFYSHR